MMHACSTRAREVGKSILGISRAYSNSMTSCQKC